MATSIDEDVGGFDPYAVLRVHPAAEADVIRAAYRALARLYHPDVSGSDEARRQMVTINRAWAILGDPASRAAFDRGRCAGSEAPSRGQAPPMGGLDPDTMPAWMARHAANRRPAGGWGAGAAGPPPGRPAGSTLDFGIYRGWSLGEVERRDPGYLDWLVDRPEGLPFRREILDVQDRRRAGRSEGRRRLFGLG